MWSKIHRSRWELLKRYNMSIKPLIITVILAFIFAYCSNLLWIKVSHDSTLEKHSINQAFHSQIPPKPIIWSPFNEENCSYYTNLIIETQNYLNKKGWQNKFEIITKNTSNSNNSDYQKYFLNNCKNHICIFDIPKKEYFVIKAIDIPNIKKCIDAYMKYEYK